MATTGTYAWNPAASNLTLVAFSRIGIRRETIQSQHMADADNEANLLQVEMTSRVPNMWKQEVFSTTLVAGTASYLLPAYAVGIRDAYITVTTGSVSFDRVMWPLSASEYDAQPNKDLQAPPQSYYVQKNIAQSITLWPVPDSSATYTFNIRLMIQMQDASQISGATLDMPYRWLDTYVAGLAYRLARIYAPDREQMRKQDYTEAWANAASEDIDDNVSMYIQPATNSYWR